MIVSFRQRPTDGGVRRRCIRQSTPRDVRQEALQQIQSLSASEKAGHIIQNLCVWGRLKNEAFDLIKTTHCGWLYKSSSTKQLALVEFPES